MYPPSHGKLVYNETDNTITIILCHIHLLDIITNGLPPLNIKNGKYTM